MPTHEELASVTASALRRIIALDGLNEAGDAFDDLILRLAVEPAFRAGAVSMRQRAADIALAVFTDERDTTTRNGLSHGCLASSKAIRALPIRPTPEKGDSDVE